MLGNVASYGASDWDADIKLAKQYGIDGFALNASPDDSYTKDQMKLAYDTAASNDFKMFVSLDFGYPWNQANIVDIVKPYVAHPAAFMVGDKALLSSFIQKDDVDMTATIAALGNVFYMPNYQAPKASDPAVSGLFSWLAWPSQDNKPIAADLAANADQPYVDQTSAAGKSYMAGVSPWMFTHLSSKNFVFKSEDLWYTRWQAMLDQADKVNYIELISWNDFGESHYLAPTTDKGSDGEWASYVAGFEHTAMLDFALPYITAYKAGQTAPTVERESIVYWHRPTLKDAPCDADAIGKPDGIQFLEDTVFVGVQTKNGGTLTVTSGANAPVAQPVAAGIQVVKIPMGVGKQSFQLTTAAGANIAGESSHEVVNTCINGKYNFNFGSGLIV